MQTQEGCKCSGCPLPALSSPLTRGRGGGARRQASHGHAWVLPGLVKCGFRRAGPGLISGAAPRPSLLSRPRACFPRSFRTRRVPDQAPTRKGATPGRRKARRPCLSLPWPQAVASSSDTGWGTGLGGRPCVPSHDPAQLGRRSSEGGPGSQAPERCPCVSHVCRQVGSGLGRERPRAGRPSVPAHPPQTASRFAPKPPWPQVPPAGSPAGPQSSPSRGYGAPSSQR